MKFENLTERVKSKAEIVQALYLSLDWTVRQVCKEFGWPYSQKLQKFFYRYFGPKGKGWGGARKGAGNKKGVEFCGKCKKAVGINCKCTKNK